MDNNVCLFVDFLYYHDDELVYIRDLVFKNFPFTYNFYIDSLDFVIQELKEKDIVFDIDNLSMEFSFGSVDSLKDYLSDIPSELLSKCLCVVECYE